MKLEYFLKEGIENYEEILKKIKLSFAECLLIYTRPTTYWVFFFTLGKDTMSLMRTIETVLSQWSKSLKGDPSSPSPSDKHDPSSPSFTHFLSPSPSLYLPSSSGGGEASSAGRQGAPARANDRPRQRCDLKRRPTGAICATQTSAPNCGAALRSMQQRPPAAAGPSGLGPPTAAQMADLSGGAASRGTYGSAPTTPVAA
jgi:hypothetical protein